LQASRDGLWILDQQTGQATLVQYSTGNVKQVIQTPVRGGSGISFDGVSLWISSAATQRLIKIDLETASVQADFETPGGGPVKWGEPGEAAPVVGAQGVEWNLGEVVLAVQPACQIYFVKSRDGAVARSIPAPGARPHGLGWDADGALWCVESNHRSFFKLDAANGQIIKQHLLPAAEPEVAGKVILPTAMTIWARYIYFCVAGDAHIYRTPVVNRMS
jgi:sugar lactone lactonase YvrE